MFPAEDLSYAGRSFCRNFFRAFSANHAQCRKCGLFRVLFPRFPHVGNVALQKTAGEGFIKNMPLAKKIFFSYGKKNFPQEIENTREIIENMSEIFQNISDIFFAIYTRADFQVLGR